AGGHRMERSPPHRHPGRARRPGPPGPSRGSPAQPASSTRARAAHVDPARVGHLIARRAGLGTSCRETPTRSTGGSLRPRPLRAGTGALPKSSWTTPATAVTRITPPTAGEERGQEARETARSKRLRRKLKGTRTRAPGTLAVKIRPAYQTVPFSALSISSA